MCVIENSATVFQQISGNIHTITTHSDQVSYASKDQSDGVNSIKASIEQMQSITAETTYQAQKSAHTSSLVAEHANRLTDVVHTLGTIVRGHKETTRTPKKYFPAAAPRNNEARKQVTDHTASIVAGRVYTESRQKSCCCT